MKNWLAPAKLNLFLHIIGRRDDGYHLLQTAIQFVDLCDQLTFNLRSDPNINCKNSIQSISSQDDLCIKAAQLLQSQSSNKKGVDIIVNKVIPLGAGMGGGSSDAATTLLALNELWDCKMSLTQLEELGQQLGADVPVFIRGHSCWVEGVGEQLTPIEPSENWYVIIYPNVHLDTRKMFADEELTRDCAPLKIRDFSQMSDTNLTEFANTENVFENIARRYPEVDRAFKSLDQYASARLTGSGSALFASCQSKQQAETIAAKCATEFTVFVVKGINESPVISLSEYNYA